MYKVAPTFLPLTESADCGMEFEEEKERSLKDEDICRRSSASAPSPEPLSPSPAALELHLPSPLAPPSPPSLSCSTSSSSSIDDVDDEGYSSDPSSVYNLESALDLAASALAHDFASSHPTFTLQIQSTTTEVDIEHAQRNIDPFPRSTLRVVVPAWRKFHHLAAPKPLLRTALLHSKILRQWDELDLDELETERYWAGRACDPKWVAANIEDPELYARNMEEYLSWTEWQKLAPEERYRRRLGAEWSREKATQRARREAMREAMRLTGGEQC
ncbi:hypothetical protein RQP46_002074 [Phenoliferia psychrophenolica]